MTDADPIARPYARAVFQLAADGAAVAGTVGNGKVPSATPTGMFSLDSRFRGNDGAVVVGGGVGVGDNAIVTDGAQICAPYGAADCVDGGGVGDEAVGDGHVRPVIVGATNPGDATIVAGGKKVSSSFPRKRESRINNSAKPTEFNAGVGAVAAGTADAAITARLSP